MASILLIGELGSGLHTDMFGGRAEGQYIYIAYNVCCIFPWNRKWIIRNTRSCVRFQVTRSIHYISNLRWSIVFLIRFFFFFLNFIRTHFDASLLWNAFVSCCFMLNSSSFQSEIKWIFCLYSVQITRFHHDASNFCFCLAWKLWWGCFEKFLLGFIFLSLLFISAASDHYLIGNNITVAVLGIVIPIGEYSCCFHSPASPCLLLHLLLSIKSRMLVFYIVWLCVCVRVYCFETYWGPFLV